MPAPRAARQALVCPSGVDRDVARELVTAAPSPHSIHDRNWRAPALVGDMPTRID
jgi:hypothetical protein